VLWIAGAVGLTGAGLRSAVGKATSGVGAQVWRAAQTDAKAWSVTWLPTPPPASKGGMRAALRGGQLWRALDRRGVAMPRYRKNLEAGAARATAAPAAVTSPVADTVSIPSAPTSA
jgi:hypothetical protein